MGVRNYLVEGVSGTGKTTVAEELARRGHHVVHGDRELAVPGGTGHEDHRWDVRRVRELAADRSRTATWFCGGSRNVAELLDVFDAVLVLHVDRDTLLERLARRPAGEWGHAPAERDLVLRLHARGDDVPAGVPVDATRPLPEVVDDLERLADPPYPPRGGRLLVAEVVRDTGTRFGQRLVEAEQQRYPRSTVEAVHLGPDEDRRRDDLVIELVRGRHLMVHPPAAVVTDPVPIPRSRGRRLVLTRRPADLRAYPIGIVTASLRAARLRVPEPLAPGLVTGRRHREVLLDLWALLDHEPDDEYDVSDGSTRA